MVTLPDNRLVVALDVPTSAEAVRLARLLAGTVGAFKVGLQLLMGPGPGVIRAIRDLGRPVFVDAKLFDIPETVRGAAAQLGRLGARWVTVHASGGRAMLEAAVEGLQQGARGHDAGILGVTVLTSFDGASLATVGVSSGVGKQTARLAKLSAGAGCEGVVCAVSELGDVAQVAPLLIKVTPGIRPLGFDADDQARAATPEEARRRGADLVVVGRPIARATDPLLVARRMAEVLG